MRILAAMAALHFVAADWPQFLGPNRDGATKETVAPWTGSPKELWKVPVGDAHSSPIVAGGVVFTFFEKAAASAQEDIETLQAIDAITGELKWAKDQSRPSYTPPFGKGPRSTPAVLDGRVFTLGNTGLLTARDANTGEMIWTRDTLKQFNAPNLLFGISTSPIVVGKNVIVMVGGKDAGIVAFDAATGNTAWKSTNDPASYSSPILDGKNLVFLTGSHLRSLTAEGREVWAYPFKDKLNESSTMPVKLDDGVLGSSVTKGSIRLRISVDQLALVWEQPGLTCYFSTPVVVGKYAYMITGAATLLNASVSLQCVELATGKVAWQKQKVGRYHAALIRTGDNNLLMLDDNGYLSLFRHDATAYRELARSKVCGVTWAHPALVNGRLYLRDEKHLICLALPD